MNGYDLIEQNVLTPILETSGRERHLGVFQQLGERSYLRAVFLLARTVAFEFDGRVLKVRVFPATDNGVGVSDIENVAADTDTTAPTQTERATGDGETEYQSPCAIFFCI